MNLLKEEFQGCDGQTDKQTNRQINLIDCWTASFAVKNAQPHSVHIHVQCAYIDYLWVHTLFNCDARILLPVGVYGKADETITKDANNDDADEDWEQQDVMRSQKKVPSLEMFFLDKENLCDILQILIHLDLGVLAQWT